MGSIELTKPQVWRNFRDNYFYYLDEECPYHAGKTSRLFKMLCEEQGLETTNDLLEFVCKKWKKIKIKYKLTGLPGMGQIYGYRISFIGDLREYQKSRKRRIALEADKKSLYLDS